MVKTAAGFDRGDDDDVTDCPECGAEIYIIGDRCPRCGHWFLEQDRRTMRTNRRNEASISESAAQLRIIKIGAAILLVSGAVFLIIAAATSIWR